MPGFFTIINRPRVIANTCVMVTIIAIISIGHLLPSRARAYTLKTTPAGEYVRWWNRPIRMKVDARLEHILQPGQAREAAVMATEAWRGLPNVPDIIIEEEDAPGYDVQRRTNGIYLMDPWPFEAERLAVTVSSYTPSGKLIGADILINAEIDYALFSEDGDGQNDTVFDIASVLTHEMGHVLGLDENPDDPQSTMWPYTPPGETWQRTLSEDDEEGVIELYTAPLPEPALGCGPASVAGRQDDSFLSLSILFLLFSMTAALRIRYRRTPSPARSI